MTCPECPNGAVMERGFSALKVTYKGHLLTIRQPGWYCLRCYKAVHTPDDIQAVYRKTMDLKESIDDEQDDL